MNNIEELFSAGPKSEFGLLYVTFSFICCVVASFILKYVYEKKSTSLSGKFHIGSILPILSQITFLIILIVKSSLALSLGLIGALSIVRFRTPIKEPEELIYLFFSIALGIGYGSGQVAATSFIFIIIIFIIWYFQSNNFSDKHFNYNLVINFKHTDKNQKLSNFIEVIKGNFSEVDIVRIENLDENNLSIVCKVTISNIDQIDDFKNAFEKLNQSDLKVSFYESRVLT